MLLALAGVALAASTQPAAANHPAPFASPLAIPQELTSPNVSLTAQQAGVQIFAGPPTQMWTYNGIFPGPTIRRPTAQTTRVNLTNSLPPSVGSISLHNHGNHSSPESDGQPDSFLVPNGGSRNYYYTGLEDGKPERGAMQWYHDHRMDVTARNVWMGMAGMYLLDDPADPQSLPSGQFDVPLMVLDRSFDITNQLSYVFSNNGVTGNHILVNGVPQPYVDVGDRKYRFRILNASNIRNYEIQMSDGSPITQIGTESGLLPAPVTRQSILLTPAERADVVIDFAGKLGQNLVLKNADAPGPPLSDLMQFRVNQDLTETSTVPGSLRPVESIGAPTVTRTFEFRRSGGSWVINGQPFDPNRIDAFPVLGSTERWILRDAGGGDHTIHIHDVDQQLLSRNGGPPPAHEIKKESWNIGGNQEVELKMKFTDHTGRYVFHCHVLEHEDDRMMGQFEVVPAAAPPPTLGFVRPRGATPLRVPLVPAFEECTSPNKTHGPALVGGSCGPASQRSSRLTVGAPAGEGGAGGAANFTGALRLDTLAGVPGGVDDTDVAVTFSAADVRCASPGAGCGAANAQAGADYAGELDGRLVLRITDLYNGDSQTQAGTTEDIEVPLTMQCSSTASTSTGGDCSLSTTFDALLPGTVREGGRANWDVAQVRVLDGGADGLAHTPDNEVFAVQGLFTP